MKKFSKILMCTITMLFLYISLAMAYNLKEYFPLDEGDSWTYSVMKDGRTTEGETRKIEGTEVVGDKETVRVILKENKYLCIAFDKEDVKIYKIHDPHGSIILNPPKIFFPNIDIGESKINEGEGGESIQISLESTIENVDVPAGKFSNCLRFSSITKWSKQSKGDYGSDNCTVWLAPGVGEVKQTCLKEQYHADVKEEETSFEISELTSAVINGEKVGQ